MSNCMNCNKEINIGKLCDKCRKADYRKRKLDMSQSEIGTKDVPVDMSQSTEFVPENVPDVPESENWDKKNAPELSQLSINVPEGIKLPLNFGLDNCTCKHCQQIKAINPEAKLNHFGYMNAEQLKLNGFTFNRVSLPSDFDYQRSYV